MTWKYEHTVKYLYQGNTFLAKINFSDRPDGETIMKYRDDDLYWEARDYYVYTSFLLLRRFLEPQGKQLLCKGCAINVRPSGNLMNSSGAYQMTMGKELEPGDVVDIFDPEEDISKIASIETQQVFLKQWAASKHKMAR